MGTRAHRLVTLWLSALVVATLAATSAADQAPWLEGEWPIRRVVDVKVERATYPGDEATVCTFYSGGMIQADGSDIRVAVQGRRLVPHRVLQIGPGDFARVAFAAAPGLERYYVYYGNPKAERPEPWELKRGVLLEARKWSGGSLDRLADVRQVWDKAAPLGADLVGHVNFSFNPFGPVEMPTAFHYTGWFVAPQPGTYEIATSSDDASWLLIDGKEVVAWPGAHGPVGDARHAGKHVLALGVHRLDYWHVNQGGPMMAVAAWRPPGAERFVAIPPAAFLQAYEAKLVETDVRGRRLVADFFPEHAGEAWWPDHYAVRMRFRNLSKGVSLQHGGRFEWDFGDGQKARDANPVHVYLAHGNYTVTLKASRGSESHTFRTTVRAERDWWRQTERKIDAANKYAEEVARYDFETLDLPSLAMAVDLFDHEGMRDPLIRAASTLVLKREGAPEEDLHRVGLLLGERLREDGRADDAIKIYRRAEQRLKTPARKAQLAVQTGEALLRNLHRHDAAEEEYQRVLEVYAAGAARATLRRAHIGMGDIRRHRGKTGEAREAYEAAAKIQVKQFTPTQAAVRIGTLARYVEEFTRKRDWEWAFKFLEDWAWEFPAEKLEGHWSLLRARALVAKGNQEEALREAMDLLAANPESPHAVRLLILAAECEVAAGRMDQARRLLQTAVEDYPEDPHQDDARQRLKTLGGAPAEGGGAGDAR